MLRQRQETSVSPAKLELAVLPEEDLLVLPAAGAATGSRHGNEAGHSQSQAAHPVHLHRSQIALKERMRLQHLHHIKLHAPPPALRSATTSKVPLPLGCEWTSEKEKQGGGSSSDPFRPPPRSVSFCLRFCGSIAD